MLLCEEKDRLLSEYAIPHVTRDQLDELDPAAIKSKKESAYGVEAIVLRKAVPAHIAVSPISIEKLFVLMAKEVK